jgi:hypothetical protein
VDPVSVALSFASLGRLDEAFEWLERAYRQRDVLLVFLRHWPEGDLLRDDPRFGPLMERIGFR